MATEKQIPKLAAALVEHQDFFRDLSIEEAQWVIQNTPDAIALFSRAIREHHQRSLTDSRPKEGPVLQHTDTRSFSVPMGKFTVGGMIGELRRKNEKPMGIVPIRINSVDFNSVLLEKIEIPTKERITVRGYSITNNSPDHLVASKLEGKRDFRIIEILSILKEQGRGEPGLLQTNGLENVFFVPARDVPGSVRFMLGVWWRNGCGWCLNSKVYPLLGGRYRVIASGTRVFSQISEVK